MTLKSLADVTAADLTAAGRALFVVSTTGEGDAPDTARRFIRDVMSGEPALHGLGYGVLALGDSSYAHFCAFGRTLDAWLARHGATPLFDRVEVDDGDPAALRHWQSHVGLLAGVTDAPDWTRPRYGRWRLAERRRLNPGAPPTRPFTSASRRWTPRPGRPATSWRSGRATIRPRRRPCWRASTWTPPPRSWPTKARPYAEVLSWRRLPHDGLLRPPRPRPWSTPCRPCPTANTRSPPCRPTAGSSCWSGP